MSCSCAPREQGPLGRETACYGERSGLEDRTRDARVRAKRRAADKASLRNVFKVLVSAGGNRSVTCLLCARPKEAVCAGNDGSGKRARTIGQARKSSQGVQVLQEPEENMSGGAVMRSLIRPGAGRVCHTSCQLQSGRGRLTSAADGPTSGGDGAWVRACLDCPPYQQLASSD